MILAAALATAIAEWKVAAIRDVATADDPAKARVYWRDRLAEAAALLVRIEAGVVQ